MTQPVVIFGVLSLLLIDLLIITSSTAVRRWSYRVFFITHLFVAFTMIPLLFFHAAPLRIYIIEAISLFIIDLAIRKLTTFTAFATIQPVPETSLVKVTIPVTPSNLSRFQYAPGQHIYLSIPPSSVPTSTDYNAHLHSLLYNPFTIASVSDTPSPHITLTMRTQNGPTTSALSSLSHLSKARPPLNIEGPYGTSRKFPNLAEKFDRVLLVAGGVGATFILPIYRAVRDGMESEGRLGTNARMIWVMRDEAECSWALPSSSPSGFSGNENGGSDDQEEEPKQNINTNNNDGIELYITSPHSSITNTTSRAPPESNTLEMQTITQTSPPSSHTKSKTTYSRPDISKIVDETFTQGLEERVAILVCGPPGMAAEVREYVGKWVERGRYVWWHDEGFGW